MNTYDYYNQFFKGRPSWVKIAVFAIVAIVLLLIVVFLIRTIRRALGYTNDNVRIDASGIKFEEGEGSVINFDPTSWVNELNDVLTSSYWMGVGITERCDTYKRVHEEVNDNQLRVINTAYEAAFGKTIREAMRSTWDSGCFIFGSIGTDYGDLLKTRLERMGI
jgi:hypothetical protein